MLIKKMATNIEILNINNGVNNPSSSGRESK
jgi:hypothetical protein